MCLDMECLETYFLHECIELCENALANIPNIFLYGGVVSAYRAG